MCLRSGMRIDWQFRVFKDACECPPDVPPVQRCTDRTGEHQARVRPPTPGLQPLLQLGCPVTLQDCRREFGIEIALIRSQYAVEIGTARVIASCPKTRPSRLDATRHGSNSSIGRRSAGGGEPHRVHQRARMAESTRCRCLDGFVRHGNGRRTRRLCAEDAAPRAALRDRDTPP